MDSGLIIYGVSLITGVVIWGLRLEGRVDKQDQRIFDFEKLVNVRFDAVDARLERIERKLDTANGKH